MTVRTAQQQHLLTEKSAVRRQSVRVRPRGVRPRRAMADETQLDISLELQLRQAESELREAARGLARACVADASCEHPLHSTGGGEPPRALRLSKESAAAYAELVVQFAREAAVRPVKEAALTLERKAGRDEVESTLPQLLLDFA